MPGIVTHNKILKESIQYLSKKDKKSYLLKSIEALFNTPEHYCAALFGCLGPNIFDYVPKRNIKNYYGNEISFFIHNGNCDKLIESMIHMIYTYKDKNTEWSAMQRAYLYGFISHIVSDSIFHPYIFYHSGFPDTFTKKEIYHYREQNLLFQYNIDNYFLYYDEDSNNFTFSIEEMLPVKSRYRIDKLYPALKTFILASIKESNPEIFKKIVIQFSVNKEMEFQRMLGYLDLIPYLIKISYWLKRSKNRRLANLIKKLRRNNILYSDFIVRYPLHKQTNKDILNSHRGRWEHPCGIPGLHYESVANLLSLTCEKTVDLWEKIESSLFEKEDTSVYEEFKINTYTGDKKLDYYDLKNKNPIRLSL